MDEEPKDKWKVSKTLKWLVLHAQKEEDNVTSIMIKYTAVNKFVQYQELQNRL